MSNKIISIEPIPRSEYVYDIETLDGNYVCGNSGIIVKHSDSSYNKFAAKGSVKYGDTDSIYTKFDFPDSGNLSKDEMLRRTWDLASECADRISDTFRSPVELEMEKIMWPLYLYGKKRYACKVYEEVYDKSTGKKKFDDKQDLKGIQAVRRDNCKLVKTICNPVFNELLNNNSIESATNFVRKCVADLFDNKFSLEEFVISKAMNSTYKSVARVKDFIEGNFVPPEKVNGRKNSVPGHLMLAKNLYSRNVVNLPQLGDRIPYAYIEVEDKKSNGSERMEDPDYIKQNPDKCKIDHMYYMEKQLSSPIYTIFEVLVKNKEGKMFPRNEKKDKKTGKISTEISKECKKAIDELLWNNIIREKCPGFNHFIKKPVKVADTEPSKQVKITDLFKS